MGRTHPKTCRWYCAAHKHACLFGKFRVSKTPRAGCDRMMAYKSKKSIDRPSVDHTVVNPPLKLFLPGTSPTKPQKHTKTDIRPERSLAAHEGHAVVTTDLLQTTFINFPDKRVISEIALAVSDWVSEVQAAETQAKGYQSIPTLLNEIARLLNIEYSYSSRVHFFASPTQPPHHHPCRNQDTPDFLAMLWNDYIRLGTAIPSWHHLVSLGEWKPGKTLSEEELSQTGAYAGSLNQARPDSPSALVFSACLGCYVIGYSDPATWTLGKSIEWTNLDPLIAFIHTLHEPKVGIVDSTITLVGNAISESPYWNIRDPAFDIDNNFKIIHVGRPHSRMTTVFQCVQSQDQRPLLVKDAWIKHYRDPELTMFKSLSSNGLPPGWVNVKPPTQIRLQLTTPQLVGITQRRKDRTMMENTGIPFEKCRKLSDAIAATYDILEADRWAITKCRILHRDVSAPNILISPVVSNAAHDGACFIKGILNGVTGEPSSALLLDLDNGTKLGPTHFSLDDIPTGTDESDKVLRELSGTPMYIARGPSVGIYLSRQRAFPTLPSLSDDISQLYTTAYTGDTLRSATGLVGTFNEGEWQKYEGKRVIQRPWHNAESTIFTLLLFLLRCSPEESPEESQKQLDNMQYIYSTIRDCGIGRHPDMRDLLLSATPVEWRLYLHEGLQGVANVVSEIGRAVSPDYEFLQPSTASIDVEVVLHEVLQRLLLQWYYNITTVNPNHDITFSEKLRRVRSGQAKTTIVIPAAESKGKYAGAGSFKRGMDRVSLEAGPSNAGGHGAAGISGMPSVLSGIEDVGLGFTDARLDPGPSRMGPVLGHCNSMGVGTSGRPKHILEDSPEQISMKKKRKKNIPSASQPRQSGRLMRLPRPNYNEDLDMDLEGEGTEVKDKKGKGRVQ